MEWAVRYFDRRIHTLASLHNEINMHSQMDEDAIWFADSDNDGIEEQSKPALSRISIYHLTRDEDLPPPSLRVQDRY